jgi:GT2 family glycosyltransferase
MLTIIIVSFNSAEVIGRCLTELLGQIPCKVLIIDNASSDRSVAGFSNQFSSVDVILLGKNTGYGRAANVGLRMASTRYALLLNPDLKVSAAQVEQLLYHAQHDTTNAAIWGPATCKEDYTGNPPTEVNWISGSAMLFDVEKIKNVGLFDENIFLFSEETDLCERTINEGYSIQFCPDVFFDHLVGQSSESSPGIEYMKWWHFGWSQCYRMTKHGQCTAWENPWRKLLSYRLHSFCAFPAVRRKKWKAKADGALAFIRGEKAFTTDDMPQRASS